MSESLVEYECRDQIATITLNRPDKLNAVNDDMVREMSAALSRFDTDNDAYVAILCGRGRAFSSGADVRQRQLRSREEFERHGGAQAQDASSHDLLLRSVNWKPVLAAVHGYVLGLALGLVLECDLIVAEAGTKFQVTETPRGLSGAKYWAMLNFRGGGAFATDVSLTGRFFTAEEAKAAGIIERVAPTGELMETARALAGEVAKNPPLGVRSTIRARRWYMGQLSREVLMQVNLAKLHLTEDFRESARAFVEKRSAGPFKAR
ncbi:MAG TPA: enoyl-CoA hydratase/isomerase family protein [Acetobacteraceae bacterium]|nr:enoyl-CoA hydratase/isomerase family protein [Acetobacteraceae bacterium]